MKATSPGRRLRLTYVVSAPVRSLHLEWLCRGLDRERFDISFILVCFKGRTPPTERFLAENRVPFRRIDFQPNVRGVVVTLLEIYRYLRRERIEIVHTHMFLASLAGLLAAWVARVPVRVYTRHNHLHNRSRTVVWLDRLGNSLATHIIALSELARADLVEHHGVPPEKLELIHLGIDLEEFRAVPPERVAALRARHGLGLDREGPVVGVIGRQIDSKGIQFVIPAFRRLLESRPAARLVLANARGPYRREIQKRLRELPEGAAVEIEFEEDVFALYKVFDVCVHVPVAEELETFGLVYVEALAAGVPGVFTLSGVAREFLEHRDNCLLVPHGDSDRIHRALTEILASEELRTRLVLRGWESVRTAFDLETMVERTERLYRRAPRVGPSRTTGVASSGPSGRVAIRATGASREEPPFALGPHERFEP